MSWTAWSLLLILAWSLRRSCPLASFGLFWIAAGLLPVSGIISLMNLQADRYLFLPSAGFCLAAAAGFSELARRFWPKAGSIGVIALTALAAAPYAAATITRNRDYADPERFYLSTLAADDFNPRTHFNLAQIYRERRPELAERHYRDALRQWPGYTLARHALASLLLVQGRVQQAISELKEAIAAHPNDPIAHYNLGLALRVALQPAEALREWQTALRLGPHLWQAHLAMGFSLLERGQAEPAAAALERALDITNRRSSLALYFLAEAFRQLGQTLKEQQAYDELKRAAPDLAQAFSRQQRVRPTPSLLP